jgi:hypothetical protein
LFREVCRNGAIMAQSIDSLHIECLGLYSLEEGTMALCDAISRCSAPQVFTKSMRDVRALGTSSIDNLLNLLPHLTQFHEAGMERYLSEILREFINAADNTQFGLMNAVTAVARETKDQDDRWRLEEMGGGIGAVLLPTKPSDAPGHEMLFDDLVDEKLAVVG